MPNRKSMLRDAISKRPPEVRVVFVAISITLILLGFYAAIWARYFIVSVFAGLLIRWVVITQLRRKKYKLILLRRKRMRAIRDQKNQRVLRLKARGSLDCLRSLHWQEFERVVLDYFEAEGFETQLTSAGADGGIDGVISNKVGRAYVQAKLWKGNVGSKDIREFFGVISRNRVKGYFVTTSKFGREARKFAEGTDLTLIDGEDLANRIAALQCRDPASGDLILGLDLAALDGSLDLKLTRELGDDKVPSDLAPIEVKQDRLIWPTKNIPPQSATDRTIPSPVFSLRQAKFGAIARARLLGSKFVVERGSTAIRHGAKSWTSYRRLRDRLIAEGNLVEINNPNLLKFSKDVSFESPSAAAAIVLARNANGTTEWRIEGSAITYQEWAQIQSLRK